MSSHINWSELLQDNDIQYVSGGKNTSRGWISIKCPFCGDADESQHLGINLAGGFWTCWRDATHRGKTPDYLLTRLLGLSKPAAALLIEAYATHTPGDNANTAPFKTPAKRPDGLPNEFKPIKAKTLTHKFWEYLYDRKFDDPDLLVEQYNLKSCLLGRWKGRLIIPAYDKKGLIGWQGRSLKNYKDVPRYLTSSDLMKKNVFNLQNLTKGNILYICEGPIDALKIDFYGKNRSIRATCTFGVKFTDDQVSQLLDLRSRFNRLILLYDSDAAGLAASFSLSEYLQAEIGSVPDEFGDPGEMTKKEVNKWLETNSL